MNRKSMTKAALLASTLSIFAASSANADAITVYSPQGEERAVWITEQAKAAGHDIEMLSAGGGELFDRLLAEKANPQADVVLGLIDAAMSSLKTEGMFQAHVPTWADGLGEVYKFLGQVPMGWCTNFGKHLSFWPTTPTA